MLDHMEDICIREGFDSVMVLVTDVTRKGSELILTGPASEIVAQAFGKTIRDNSLFLEGVVSRKKQILPKLAQVVE